MSLHAVLSAMRALILDGLPVPEDETERRVFYAKRFDPLSGDELEDLVKIPPAKFKIYTGTVFSGQRGTLEMHFPITFALLEARLGKEFDPFQMVQDIHQFAPWKGYQTKGLAESFYHFLREHAGPWSLKAPESSSIAEMECLSLDVARGLNPYDKGLSGKFPRVLNIEEIEKLSIGDLLSSSVFIPDNVRFLSSDFDVLELRTSYYLNEKTIPNEATERRVCFFAGGRDSEQYVRWQEVSEKYLSLLKSAQSEKNLIVQDLAESFLEVPAQGKSEQILFQEFLEGLWNLHHSGILFIRAPELSA